MSGVVIAGCNVCMFIALAEISLMNYKNKLVILNMFNISS